MVAWRVFTGRFHKGSLMVPWKVSGGGCHTECSICGVLWKSPVGGPLDVVTRSFHLYVPSGVGPLYSLIWSGSTGVVPWSGPLDGCYLVFQL